MGFNFHGNNFSNSKFFFFVFLFFCFKVYHKINGNDLSNVKICDFFFSLLACPPCRSRISAMSEKRKKKKDTARTPKSSEPYQYPC